MSYVHVHVCILVCRIIRRTACTVKCVAVVSRTRLCALHCMGYLYGSCVCILYNIPQLCSSCSAADKGDACQCVANWVFNHDYLQLLLKHGIVAKLSALLLDDSVSVREVAAGAFR